MQDQSNEKNKIALNYTQAVVNGIHSGVKNLVETVTHPIDKIIIPLTCLYVDSKLIHDQNIFRFSAPSLKLDPQIYNTAFFHMQQRKESLQNFGVKLLNGPGPERLEILTEITVSTMTPGIVVKGLKFSKNYYKFGTPKNPPLFKPRIDSDIEKILPPVDKLTVAEIRKLDSKRLMFVYTEGEELIITHTSYFRRGMRGRPKFMLYAHPEIANLEKSYIAGEVFVKKGKIVEISNYSGHYRPVGKHLGKMAEKVFKRNGFEEAKGTFFDIQKIIQRSPLPGVDRPIIVPGKKIGIGSSPENFATASVLLLTNKESSIDLNAFKSVTNHLGFKNYQKIAENNLVETSIRKAFENWPTITEPQIQTFAENSSIDNDQILSFIKNQSNDLMKEFAIFKKDFSKIKQDEELRRKKEEFDKKITTAQNLALFGNALGSFTKDDTLKAFSATGFAVAQGVQGAAAILAPEATALGVIGGWALIGTAALTIMSQLFHDNDSDPSYALGMQTILQQVYEGRLETREFFGKNFENQRVIYEAISEGIVQTLLLVRNKSDDSYVSIKNRLDQIELGINHLGSVLDKNDRENSLKNFRQILHDAKACLERKDDEQNSRFNPRQILHDLSFYSEFCGESSLSVYTGIHWLPRRKENHLCSFVDNALLEINASTILAVQGYLAYYARDYLDVPLTNVQVEAVFNPVIWSAAVNMELKLFNAYPELLNDKLKNLNGKIQAAENYERYIEAVRTSALLYETLFNSYQKILTDIKQVFLSAIESQNEEINEKINTKFPEVKKGFIKIEDQIESTLGKFNGKLPFTIEIRGGVCHGATPRGQGEYFKPLNYYPEIGGTHYEKVMDCSNQEILSALSPFLLSVLLGFGGFTNSADIDIRKCFYGKIPVDINIGFNNQPLLTINRELHFFVLYQYVVSTVDAKNWGKGLSDNYEKLNWVQNIYDLMLKEHEKHKKRRLQDRKIACQHCFEPGNLNTGLKNLCAKLDEIIKLLNGYLLSVGLNYNHLELFNKKIWDSKKIIHHFEEYISSGKYDDPLPMITIFPDFELFREKFLQIISDDKSFNDSDCFLTIKELKQRLKVVLSSSAIKSHIQTELVVNAGEKNLNPNVVDNPKPLRDQSNFDKFKKILKHHKNGYSMWSSKKYLQAIPKNDDTGLYNRFSKQLLKADVLMEKINNNLESGFVGSETFFQLMKLNKSCRKIHESLRFFLPQQVYPFGANDFNFLVKDGEELKSIEKTF